jgi:hypothetical protein
MPSALLPFWMLFQGFVNFVAGARPVSGSPVRDARTRFMFTEDEVCFTHNELCVRGAHNLVCVSAKSVSQRAKYPASMGNGNWAGSVEERRNFRFSDLEQTENGLAQIAVAQVSLVNDIATRYNV